MTAMASLTQPAAALAAGAASGRARRPAVLEASRQAVRCAPHAALAGSRVALAGARFQPSHGVCRKRAPRSLLVQAIASPPRPSAPAPDVQPAATLPVGGDPWEDERWRGVSWTVYRDVAYDLGPFFATHPGGNWLLRLAVGRDSTALVESYHLRPETVDARFKRLPKLADFPVAAVPRSPRPNDSELYNAIRDRVRNELFGGKEHGAHRQGGNWAVACILGYAALAYCFYAALPGAITGAFLGLGGAWIGLTVQHCANHGAMSTSATANNLLGMTDDLIGGSSLMWRYHHQVSHHVHCNDTAFDEDVFSAFPLLRFDARLPRFWYHRFQHIYMWALFPLMQVAFQIGDVQALFQRETAGTKLHGVTAGELATVALGKVVHFGLLLGPALWAGWTSALVGMCAFIATQGIVLAATFAVSHNVPEAKVAEETDGAAAERDWGRQQVLTSADWGGVVGNFFTGGLNLQVEHHLFPAVCFVHYPAIAAIVKDECAKRDVPYFAYTTLPSILARFVGFMRDAGAAEQRPMLGRVDFRDSIDSAPKAGGRAVPMPGQSGCPIRLLQ